MLTGIIRPVETRTVDVEGDSLADIHAKLIAQVPAGWELTKAPVTMTAGVPICLLRCVSRTLPAGPAGPGPTVLRFEFIVT